MKIEEHIVKNYEFTTIRIIIDFTDDQARDWKALLEQSRLYVERDSDQIEFDELLEVWSTDQFNVPAFTIYDMWENPDESDRRTVIEYRFNDAEAATAFKQHIAQLV